MSKKNKPVTIENLKKEFFVPQSEVDPYSRVLFIDNGEKRLTVTFDIQARVNNDFVCGISKGKESDYIRLYPRSMKDIKKIKRLLTSE